MGLDSYLELFTTMFGWSFAANIVSVLSETGLTALPLLFLFIGTWLQAHEQGLENGGVTWMIRQLEVKLFSAIFVYITCVQGWAITSIANMSLTYTPAPTAVEPAPTTVAGNATGTSYDAAFNGVPGIANVPPWWFTVMAVSSGVNAAVKAGTATTIRDLRAIQDIANTATISDTRLRSEMQRFNVECFVPARSRFLAPEFVATGAVAAIATYGDADVNWPGSHAFQEDAGLYPSLYASAPVPGFVFSFSAEPDIGTSEPAPEWARPSCDQWWADAAIGLRKKLSDHVGAWGRLESIIAATFSSMSAQEQVDYLARLAFTKVRPNYTPMHPLGMDPGDFKNNLHGLFDLFGAAGATNKAFEAALTMFPLITLITMAQPLLLMVIYMFLPIATVFSGYDLKIMVMGAIGMFTVKFWSVMWWIARWVDDKLIAVMYPDSNMFLDMLTPTGMDNNFKRMILNILLMVMYVAMPAIWTAVMAWGGHRLSTGMDMFLKEVGGIAKEAGQRGHKIASSMNRPGSPARGSR